MKFTYKWNLSDLLQVENNGLSVFSCFSCGGGSTMGYKMSGFNVIGCNDIDPKMMQTYIENHSPKYHFLESIETLKRNKDLPVELFNLDILDGSPPCSSFSMAGSREKSWGENKKFREGQVDQVLDDLFFHYIDLGKRLRPKIIVAENVKGMIQGKAKGYVKEIISLYKKAGYDVQLFLLNGATMGLPQKRERVFFICRRRDLDFPPLEMIFAENPIAMKEVRNFSGKDIINCYGKDFDRISSGEKKKYINSSIVGPDAIHPTVLSGYSSKASPMPWDKKWLSVEELSMVCSFPLDYKFPSERLAFYQMGMAVPPMMMHKVSEQIKLQWFNS